MLKHLTDALVGLGGTLKVLVGTDLLADLLALLRVSKLVAPIIKGVVVTCSGVTGFWLVLCSSSIVFWS